MRRILTASMMLAFVLSGWVLVKDVAPATGTLAAAAATPAKPVPGPRRACSKTYTVAMATRAARAVYSGTRKVNRGDRQMLRTIRRCLRNPGASRYVVKYYRRQARLHEQRVHPPMAYATASWYDDAGATASGSHAYYGVAHLSLPFGTKVRFCYHGNCITAVVDDRGPYVGGREWDLNQNTASALGFSGVDTVGYHIY